MLKRLCRILPKTAIMSLLALFSTALCSFGAGTAIGAIWSKSQVTPVVLVKPGIGGFVPTDGTSLGNTWSKNDVKAVLLVKPGIGGFEPVEGISIGNQWTKGDVIAVTLTEPSGNGFSPMQLESAGESEAAQPSAASSSATSSVIESQIEGDFSGWDGETIIKLTNGQIWQQSSYHYEYHYAFMPKVLIFKTGSGFKAKVDGTDQSVDVTRLR